MKKRTNIKGFAFFILFVFVCSGLSAQQAWTRPKGKYYAQIGASMLSGNSLLNGTEPLMPLGRDIADVTLQAYGEYGLTDRLTFSAQVPFKILSASNAKGEGLSSLKDGSLAAFSNLQAALMANVLNKNGYVLSGKTGISLPTAMFEPETGLRSGFDALSVSPSILAGIGRAKFFSSAEIGLVFRTNGYSKRFFAAWQIGKFIGKNKRWLPILGLEYMKSGNDGTYDDGTSIETGLYLNRQSYLSPNVKLGFKANEKVMLWVSGGGGLGTVTRNILASPGLSFSISYQN
jgi:hypothetical protein